MDEFESEDQQIEAIKKWWKENGASLVLGLAIGVGGLLGWREYLSYKTDHSAQASDLYQAVQAQVVNNRLDDAHIEKANIVRAEYSDTPYAALVSMAQARYEYENGDVESAIMHLRWASDNASEGEMQHLARLRLARILIAEAQHDEAEAILSADYPAGFAAGYEELKGDLFLARGEVDQARVAYDKAIDAADGNASRWLLLKRQDLGRTDPGAT